MSKELTIKLTLKTGKTGLRFGDCFGTVYDDDGQEVGALGGLIGAGYEIQIGGERYAVFYKDIWNAAAEAAGLPELAFETTETA